MRAVFDAVAAAGDRALSAGAILRAAGGKPDAGYISKLVAEGLIAHDGSPQGARRYTLTESARVKLQGAGR